MQDDLLKYKIGIGLIPGIGSVLAKKLISYVGSVDGVFKEKKSNLQKIPGIGERLSEEIAHQDILSVAEEEIVLLEKNNISPVFYLDKGYPERLKHCEDSPVIIFTKGAVDFNRTKFLSIVGTRNATYYGKEICNKIIEEFAGLGHDITVVSGLAYGIDIQAHKAALKNNFQTIAVLGQGFEHIYPSQHKPIADKIISQGALVTEFLFHTKPDAPNFVKRNRIVAGISDATIVIESGESGGALITAELANSYNRDVFAIPGRSGDTWSKGCNNLVKANKAALVESAKDIEMFLQWDAHSLSKPVQISLFNNLTDEQKTIIETLRTEDKLSIDFISLKSQLPVSKVSSLLLNLEFQGLVKCLPGKVFCLTG